MNLMKKAAEAAALVSLAPHDVGLDTKALLGKIFEWKHAGEKTFLLSNDLINAFIHTDIPMDVKPADFHYPFDTFMIEGQVPLFSTELPKVGAQNVHHVLYTDVNKIVNDHKGDDLPTPSWDIAITGIYSVNKAGLDSLVMHTRKDASLIDDVFGRKPSDTMYDIDKDDIKNLVNIFYNTVLYINDPSRNKEETEEVKIRNFKDVKTNKFYNQEYISLKAPKSYKSIPTGTGRKLDKRVTVRGHWANIAYGKGRSLRRLQWIKPYQKGPISAETSNKKYAVR